MSIKEAIDVLKLEAQSILDLTEKIGPDFETLTELIMASPGRVIVSGIGKSGLIGRKIVATLASTGTNAMFLHPVEAMHGDLGMVSGSDIVIAISNSGETGELNILMPAIRDIGCRIIAFTGNPESTLAKLSSLVIDTGVKREACSLNLAPTCSTTAQLAMGDALAVVLMNRKRFQASDFKRSHPGGALGQRLTSSVGEIMLRGDQVPVAPSGASMDTAIEVMEKTKLGAVIIVTPDRKLAGIITDGDIRHCVASRLTGLDKRTVDSLMTRAPHTVLPQSPLYDALNLMEVHQITVLPVIDHNRKLEGILHLHDILGKGAFKFNGS